MRAISRVLGISLTTVLKLQVDAGVVCKAFHDEHVRGVRASRVQADEIWSYCYAKQKNAAEASGVIDGVGDVWTWTGMDSDTKLIISWLVSPGRDAVYAYEFMNDLKSRLAGRVQLTTDQHKAYVFAVEGTFKDAVDFSQLVKRYREGQDVEVESEDVIGDPDPEYISTSYVERHNLTMRMSLRRFARRTNAFSKKVANHMHALALYFAHYNFVREHQSLGTTPAVAAGLAEYPYNIRWIGELIDERYAAGRS